MEKKEKKNVKILPVLRAYSRAALRYPFALSLLILGILGMQFASITIPLYLKQFIDLISQSQPSESVVQALFALLWIYAGIGAINWVSRRIQMWSIARVEFSAMGDLENEAFEYLIKHSHDFFTSNFVGTLSRRVTRYSRAFEQVLDSITFTFAPSLIFGIGSVVVLYTRNSWLGLGVLAWIVVYIVAQIIMIRWQRPLRAERVAADSKMTGLLSDAISNHSSITLFANERHEAQSLAKAVDTWYKASFRSFNTEIIVQGVQQGLAIAIEVGILFAAVFLWQQSLITVGDFVLINVYIIGLIDQMWGVGNTLRRMQDSFADAYEMIEIMDTPYEVQDAKNADILKLQKGTVDFSKVSFWFDTDRHILKDLNLSIAGGEKVALVGPSGAGKSTITKLLLRLYDVKDGSVEIDGTDIREVTQESLRQAIAFVPQEPVLFHRTLKENIAYGKLDATDEEIIEAAKKAHCHEFIMALPEGYDTHVGERGVKLSGGERQRVAIARAILKDAPILILDEATSSLDSESEALIQDALQTLMQGKTVIVIAHRLSTIMRMDRIIVIEGGKVIDTGTHQELLAKDGLYQKLWSIQAGGFLQEEPQPKES